jgi:hypothetical protein
MLFPTAGGGLYVRNEMFRTGPGASPLNDASGGGIAQAFVTSYFQIFDSDRRGLAAIYVRDGPIRGVLGPAIAMMERWPWPICGAGLFVPHGKFVRVC